MALNYLELAELYRPEQISALLIGEAPPPCGTKYFYLPQRMNNDIPIKQDRSLPATIFWHYFQRRPQNEEEYQELLTELKNAGIFLVDILDQPLKIRGKKENEAKLIAQIPYLKTKLDARKIVVSEEQMIFLLARNSYKKILKNFFSRARLIPWIDFRLSFELLKNDPRLPISGNGCQEA